MKKHKSVVMFVPVDLPKTNAWFTSLAFLATSPIVEKAVESGAQEIADEWSNNAPVRDGWYRDSIRVDMNNKRIAAFAGGIGPDSVLASIYPHRVSGPEEDEQPYRYASVLEFGGVLGPKQRKSTIPAQPSARPAFDAAAPRAQAKIAAALRLLFR